MILSDAFPPEILFPELLEQFQVWVEERQPGDLGWFDFAPTRLDDYWIENGSAIAEQFALFLRLPDGSAIGFWKYVSNFTATNFPVVLLGSEGQQEVLAPDLPSFLWKWADGDLRQAYDLEFDPEYLEQEGLKDARPELREWLSFRGVAPPLERGEEGPDSAALQAFFSSWQEQQAVRWAGSSSLQSIASLLERHASPGMKDWEAVSLRIGTTDAGLTITHSPLTQSEQAEAEPLIERLREEMAQEYPDRGLWFSAEVRWFREFGATIRANYLSIPEELGDEAIRETLTRFPRGKFWLPEKQ